MNKLWNNIYWTFLFTFVVYQHLRWGYDYLNGFLGGWVIVCFILDIALWWKFYKNE